MTSPPPDANQNQVQSAPPPQDHSSTPVRKSLQGSERYAVKHSELNADIVKNKMAGELAGQWVGPMPVKDFITEFLPLPPSTLATRPIFSPTFFQSLVKQKREVDMYKPFSDSVALSGALPGFKLVDTSQHPEEDPISGMKNKPDVAVYRLSVNTNEHPTKYEDMELIIEFKTAKAHADPFQDNPRGKAKQTDFPFEPAADEREKCRGQLACYARIWCARQHRTHCFILWIGDPHARIIRFDRSGGIVSAKFSYRTESDLLLQFLWHHSVTVDQARGMDPTVARASPVERKIARDKLFDWMPSSDRSVYKLEVPDPVETDKKKTRSVLVWGPLADPRSVTGRATRGYPAWYPEGNNGEGCVVFVKDSWRSCEEGMEKECDILKELNAHDIPNVPILICGDDIRGQYTRTQDYACNEWNIGGRPEHFVKRVHTRFAEDVVGKHLHTFNNSRDFLRAIYDAFIAHKLAYEKCGILHRDISAGNILMKKEGGGILNDWDLAKRIDMHTLARQPFRSGTFQYMSAGLLRNPSKFNSVQDDLESFLWVVLYHVLRYMKHSHPVNELEAVMQNIFDQETAYQPGQHAEGGMGKYVLLMLRVPLEDSFEVIGNKPLTIFIDSVIEKWKDWYQYPLDVRASIKKLVKEKDISEEDAKEQIAYDTSTLAMATHDAMVTVFEDALAMDKWPKGDEAVDHLPMQKKREREARDYSSSDSEDSDAESETSSTTQVVKKVKKLKTYDNAAYRPGGSSRPGSSLSNALPPRTLFPRGASQKSRESTN